MTLLPELGSTRNWVGFPESLNALLTFATTASKDLTASARTGGGAVSAACAASACKYPPAGGESLPPRGGTAGTDTWLCCTAFATGNATGSPSLAMTAPELTKNYRGMLLCRHETAARALRAR